ncbi:MAG: tetratricopeptide repeat protein [Elusimicrobia bacterium]|nr:tetratricopeptide repeat protein [Elusimicrobiota bacterium]
MTGAALIAVLRRDHEGWVADCSARLRWPFAMELDLFYHRRLHARRLRELFAAADARAGKDDKALAARGRLRRLLGDDAGAVADLRSALDRDPSNVLARAWLAELDLGGKAAEQGLTEALEGKGAPVEARYYRAVSRLIRGDFRGAAVDAREARKARPKDAFASLLLGTALERSKRRSLALSAYAEAGRLDPNCSVSFMLSARLAPSTKLRDEALEGALRADPCYALITLSWFKPGVSWDAHAKRLVAFAFRDPELAGWYQRQQEIHYAPYHFEEYEAAKSVHARRPDSPWAAALVARGVLRCPPDPARNEEGLRLADAAVRAQPVSGWMRSWRALGLMKAGRRDESLAELTKCLQLQPYYHRAIAWRGGLLRGMGKGEDALRDLDTACGIDELYPFSAHERSLARRLVGDWVGAALELDRAYRLDSRYAWIFTTLREPTRAEFAKAEADLTRAIARHPSCASLRAWRGDTRRLSGDLSGAIRELRDAVALDPAHANALAFLGRALLDAGRAKEALDPLLRATKLAPDQRNFGGWRAEALFRVGRHAEAFALLGVLMKEVPPIQVWWVLHLRAELLMERGRPKDALKDLKAAERCEGRHADGYYLCARAKLALGDARGAEAEIGKALTISPNMGRAYLLRAEARRRQGKADAVLADYRVVLERFPFLFNEEERGRVSALLGNPE